METPARRQAQSGQNDCFATAAGVQKIAQGKGRAMAGGLYHVIPERGKHFDLYTTRREAWALDRLRKAGPNGCAPKAEPAPRWSAYIHTLRGRGVPIVTIYEAHGGGFSGMHGRYILRATVVKGGCT